MNNRLGPKLYYGILKIDEGFVLVTTVASSNERAIDLLKQEGPSVLRKDGKLIFMLATSLPIGDITSEKTDEYEGKIAPLIDDLNSQQTPTYDSLESKIRELPFVAGYKLFR